MWQPQTGEVYLAATSPVFICPKAAQPPKKTQLTKKRIPRSFLRSVLED
jgi:hypothetical protein